MKHKFLLPVIVALFCGAALCLSDNPNALAEAILTQINELLISALIERFTKI